MKALLALAVVLIAVLAIFNVTSVHAAQKFGPGPAPVPQCPAQCM